MRLLLNIHVTSLMTFSTSVCFQRKADIYQRSGLVLHVHLNILLILSAQKLLLASQQHLFTYPELTVCSVTINSQLKKKNRPFTFSFRVRMIVHEDNSMVKYLPRPCKC